MRIRIAALLAVLLVAPCAHAAERIFGDGFEAAAPVPMPLISRGEPTAASSGNGAAVVDGTYFGWATWDVAPSAQAPEWVAIHLAATVPRAMISWVAFPNSVVPADYRIETSADSSNGVDGTWSLAFAVDGNAAPSRAHPFELGGRRWIRFVVTRAQVAGQGISINEIDVHDASAGTSDTWMFIGDSITAAAFSRGLHADDFPERVHAATPAFFPLMIGAGQGGTSTIDGVAAIDAWIALHPHMQNWVISYGTNDSATGDPSRVPEFGARLRVIVGKLIAAGKTVRVPRIPYKTGGEAYLPAFNAEIDAVRAEFGLGPAPDLYAWFIAHQEQLADGVHPTEDGSRAMNLLWAQAVRDLYP